MSLVGFDFLLFLLSSAFVSLGCFLPVKNKSYSRPNDSLDGGEDPFERFGTETLYEWVLETILNGWTRFQRIESNSMTIDEMEKRQ
jgi:hypothetical protein